MAEYEISPGAVDAPNIEVCGHSAAPLPYYDAPAEPRRRLIAVQFMAGRVGAIDEPAIILPSFAIRFDVAAGLIATLRHAFELEGHGPALTAAVDQLMSAHRAATVPANYGSQCDCRPAGPAGPGHVHAPSCPAATP